MKNNIFSVAISNFDYSHYRDVGYLEYDSEKKSVEIFLQSEELKEKAQKFFASDLTIQVPHETMHDFTTTTIKPLADLESFKIALTRLWENTDIYVDWSRPVEYVREHPTLD